MRFLLRPGWIALTVGVLAFAFACAYLLAPWQFHRSTERDGANAALQNALTLAPVPREEIVAPGTEPSPAVKWRQVRVVGTYLPVGEVLVRLRSIDGGAGSEVLTPLRTPSGETLLVDRGYLRLAAGSSTAVAVPPAPAGPVTLVGYQLLDEPASDRAAIDEGGRRQVYAANAGQIAATTGVPAAPGYIQLLDGQAGVLTAVPLPQLDPNSSYSYAWQWMIFGVMAVGAWFYFVRLEYVTRREEQAGAPEDEPQEPQQPRETGPRTTADVLADRYGRR